VPTARKAGVIEDLTEKLTRANAAALIDYRGLTVAEISELRRQLRQREVELEVTKNTLLREAAHRNDMMELDELFVGPTAVAFIYGDEPTGTKTLNEFFRTARVGAIKSGILKGGRRLTAQEFARLAELPSRQTLLAQIAGLLQSPMAQLAALFNAPAQQLAYALNALIEKGGAGGEDGAGGAGVPETPGAAPEAAADAEPPAPETA
jgi:large subunit ribosomal protein L10